MVLFPSSASADTARIVHVAGAADACPTPGAVVTALTPLLPRLQITTEELAGDRIEVQVLDLGSRYRVSVMGSEREFEDRSHSCQERAHATAVFVAVMIELPTAAPPEVTPTVEPPPAEPAASTTPAAAVVPTGPPAAPTPAATERPPAVRASEFPRIVLEAGGGVGAAPRSGTDNSLIAAAGALRLTVGAKYFGASLGYGILSPVTIALPVGGTELTRIPLDLGARISLPIGRFELLGDAGVAIAILFLKGVGLPVVESGTRVEVGLRLAFALRFWIARRWAPFFAVEGAIVPSPHEIAVEPMGIVGKTPNIWLGATIGLALRIH